MQTNKLGLLIACQNMIRALQDQYGTDVGYQKGQAMMDAIDPELQYDLVQQALTGFQGKLVCDDVDRRNKIAAIKAIRRATGLALKPAKELTDRAELQPVDLPQITSFQVMNDLTRELENTSYRVI